MSDAGAVAVWCVARDSAPESRFEAHFNYWRFPRGDAGRRDFMEVGVLLERPAQIESVHVYLPFVPGAADVSDLGNRFVAPGIAQGIFNLLLDCRMHSSNRWVDLDNTGKAHSRVLVLGEADSISDARVSTEKTHAGVILGVSPAVLDAACEGLTAERKVYLRLRVAMPIGDENAFVKVKGPKDWLFQSGFEEIEFIDFRLNDPRTLPDAIEQRMRAPAGRPSPKISMVAFLTAVPLTSEVAISHEEAHKIRRLERDVWKPYVSGGIPEGMLVYHWKKEAREPDFVSDFAAFVKLQTRRSGWKTVAPYLGVAFVFGVLGNLVAGLIQAMPWFVALLSACMAIRGGG